jgi:hypothetical protein
MAITRKPKSSINPATAVNVDALINKGGKPAQQPSDGAATPVIVRLPAEMLAQVDAAVAARPIRTPRHTWILEAIHEKLQRS